MYILIHNGPSAGVLDAEIPKSKKKHENEIVTKYLFFLRICTIICMREAVTISYGS